MHRGIRAVLMAILVVSSLWVGIGLGIALTERKPSAEVRSIGENRIEIWKGGVRWRPAHGCVTRMQPTFNRGITLRNWY